MGNDVRRCNECGLPIADESAAVCPKCGTTSVLPTTAAGSAADDSADRIGPYRILTLLGEGGMGAVYLAEQQVPHRRVAVKVIKAGMDTRQVVGRFDVEREALAMMDHPNIAAVYEAGTTSGGRPYFAMEYVAGVPITDYCDRHQLTTRDRLSLFLQVCAAIHHAHQKGVIHRDIKPSNILVTVVDGRPQPKVIDFGVAKAINHRLTEKTVFTELGILIGTPGYMSPEQAEMTGLDIDTTTDIYALGVLLYELLAGALPFDPKRLRSAGFDEIRRIIREEEPAKPSTRLSGLGPAATEVARKHHTDLTTLTRQLQGDLDWITLKAMEKDRTRRYGSASELAADLQRHIADEPVLARPTGVGYRARKFVKRHRAAVGGAVAGLLFLTAFGVAMAVQSARIAVERDAAARERDRAEAVSTFMTSLFEASDPNRSKGEKVSARQLLDQGRQRLERELVDQPQTRAALLHTIGRVYRILEVEKEAESAIREALKIRESATGKDRGDYADTLYELGRLNVRVKGRVPGDLDEQVLRIRREVFGPEHPKVAQALGTLASNYRGQGKLAESERYYKEAIAMSGRVNALADQGLSKVNLAALLNNQGRFPEAIDLLREAIPVLTQIHGTDHTSVLTGRRNLSIAYSRMGRNEEAEPVQRENLQVMRRLFGPAHFNVAGGLQNLGDTLNLLGQYDEAERLFREALEIYQRGRAGPHEQLAWTLSGLASILKNLERYQESERDYREALVVFKAADVKGDAAAWALDGLGDLYYKMRRFDDAERVARDAIGIRNATKGDGSVFPGSHELLARVVCEQKASSEGEQLARESLTSREQGTPPNPAAIAMAEAILGRCLAAAKRFDEAEKLLLGAHAQLAGSRGPGREDLRYAARSLVFLYDSWPKPDQAAVWRAKAQ